MSTLIKKVITVKFNERSEEYSYFCDDITIKPEDTVVVEASGSYGLAVVVKTYGLSQAQKDNAAAWVVQRVDFAQHQERLEAHAKRDVIMQKLEEAVADSDGMDKFRAVADKNPQVAELLGQLDNLGATAITHNEAGAE